MDEKRRDYKRVWTAITVSTFIIFFLGLEAKWLQSFNHAIGHSFVQLRQNWLNPIVELYTWFGNTIPQTFWFMILVVVLYVQRRSTEALWVIICGITVSSIVSIVKHFVAYARPDWGLPIPDSYSFPSGHSAGIACFVTLLYRCYPTKALGISMGIVAIAMGLSRLYLGVHWASDVIVGCLIGFTVALYAPLNRTTKKQKSKLEMS